MLTKIGHPAIGIIKVSHPRNTTSDIYLIGEELPQTDIVELTISTGYTYEDSDHLHPETTLATVSLSRDQWKNLLFADRDAVPCTIERTQNTLSMPRYNGEFSKTKKLIESLKEKVSGDSALNEFRDSLEPLIAKLPQKSRVRIDSSLGTLRSRLTSDVGYYTRKLRSVLVNLTKRVPQDNLLQRFLDNILGA